MDKRFFICIVVILALAVLAILAYNNLEIYQVKNHLLPSYEVMTNTYYALEEWLNETGHAVRIERESDPLTISIISESAAIILASAVNWEDAGKFIIPWIESGNSLVICLDHYVEDQIDENLIEFLCELGIYTEMTHSYSEAVYRGSTHEENVLNLDRIIKFNVDEETEILTIKDHWDETRLVELSVGKGKLTVTGAPRFMYNEYLNKEINARLAWELTGARAAGENKGVFFVSNVRQARQSARNSMFGSIMERGNLAPLGVSALLVILIGFWMVIPVFGFIFEEKPKNSRPIRERFAAETGFLKKYGGLNYYLETYERELPLTREQQSAQVSEKENNNYREIINKLRSKIDGKNKYKH